MGKKKNKSQQNKQGIAIDINGNPLVANVISNQNLTLNLALTCFIWFIIRDGNALEGFYQCN